MEKTQAIMLYKDMQPFIDMMNNEQAGIILKAIYNYSCNNVEFKSDDSLLQSVFTFAKNKIDLSNDNYKKKCERNAENARKRWQKDNATACERIPEDANECLTKTKTKTKLKENKTNLSSIGSAFNLETIWSCYPQHRRNKKTQLTQFWKANFLDGKQKEIEKGLKCWLVSQEWEKENGKFIPSIYKWIEEEQYLAYPNIEECYSKYLEQPLLDFKTNLENNTFDKTTEKQYDFSNIKF